MPSPIQVHASEVTVSFTVNGQVAEVTTWPMRRLLDVLREELTLTGTKEGCGEGECGACSVFVNGKLVNSCLVPIIQLQGADVTTIEGVADGTTLTALQQAFITRNGAQCGICTPGMIMAAATLLSHTPRPEREEIREALSGNLCRCTGYMKIFDAVAAAAETLAPEGTS